MSLREEIVEWFGGRNRWPGQLVGDLEGVSLVADEMVDSSRWSIHHEAVYRRGDEYVGVAYAEPATEMQTWDDFDEPRVYNVKPVEVTTTKYVREVADGSRSGASV